jgi:CDP-diacylglycerol--glycerol-3-phosphate 3-phosphatidyltransferase
MNQTKVQDPLAQYKAKDSIFTPSNLISLMRAVMVGPAVFAIIGHLNRLAAAICVVAFISDLLDGFVARRLNEVSEMGKIIDPLADKIFVGVVVIAMALFGYVPIWFLVAILTRDLIIVGAGIWATRRYRVVLPSNYPGKGAVLVISLTIFLILTGVTGTTIVFMESLSLLLMVISLGVYAQRLWGIMRAVPGEATATSH